MTDRATLEEPSTDTARLAETGAAPVVWAIARAAAAEPAWTAVRRLVAARPAVVMEGSTITRLARAVVVNVPAAESRAPSPEVMAEVRRHRGHGRVIVADVTRPVAEWAPELVA